MNPELESMLDRADELLKDLEDEYKKCLHDQNITERVKNLTHEVLERLRHTLDHTIRKAWDKYIATTLSEQDRKRARVYFPIANDLYSFHSILGRAYMSDSDKSQENLYNLLLKKQPFSSKDNQWLDTFNKIVAEGKHVQLMPQKRIEKISQIKVSGRGGEVSWNPSSVKFGPGVRIMGVSIDPRTQRIVPTPRVTEHVEILVAFIFDDYGVSAPAFCKEACQKTRALIEEMVNVLKL